MPSASEVTTVWRYRNVSIFSLNLGVAAVGMHGAAVQVKLPVKYRVIVPRYLATRLDAEFRTLHAYILRRITRVQTPVPYTPAIRGRY